MRVFFDHQAFARQSYGGVSRYFVELIRSLLSSNEENIDISVFFGIHKNCYSLPKTDKQVNKILEKKISLKIPSHLLELINLVLWGRCIASQKCDIYHQTYYRKYSLPKGAKRVVTCYDMTHELYPSMFPLYDLTRFYKKNVLPSADGIICISDYTKQKLQELMNVKDVPVAVIYPGVSLPFPLIPTGEFEFPYILYVGSRSQYKNFSCLLKAFERLNRSSKDVHLVCFGGAGFCSSEVNEIVERKLDGKCHWISGDDQRLARTMMNAEMLVYPSLMEGFGFPPLEAMSLGCPCVVSDAGALPEVAATGALFFNPNSPDELVSQIQSVLEESSLRQELRQSGFERAKKFSWQECAHQTLKFYHKLL